MPRKSMTDGQMKAFANKLFARKDTPIIGDYLQALANTGLYGNTREEVVRTLVCRGIEKAIANDVIPRRHVEASYPVAAWDT